VSYPVSLAIGAALIAGWLDWRFKERRPVSLARRACHLAAAYAALQTATACADYLIGANAAAARQLGVVFVLVLPSIVYAFLAGLWLVRTLADVARLARR